MTETGLKREYISVPADWKDSRDSGKMFLISEWPATRAERWGRRMILAMKGTSAVIPNNIEGLGMVGVAILTINAFLRADINPDLLDALMDQMMECVQIIRVHSNPDLATPIVSDTDIMDVRTLMWLRSEVLRVHTGFSSAEALSKLISTAMTPVSSSTSTSPGP